MAAIRGPFVRLGLPLFSLLVKSSLTILKTKPYNLLSLIRFRGIPDKNYFINIMFLN